MFYKIKGLEVKDKFNKDYWYFVGLYKCDNSKNVYQYSAKAYHQSLKGITPIKDTRKRFKNEEEAEEYYKELIVRYS